jgi:hypothetical protein
VRQEQVRQETTETRNNRIQEIIGCTVIDTTGINKTGIDKTVIDTETIDTKNK